MHEETNTKNWEGTHGGYDGYNWVMQINFSLRGIETSSERFKNDRSGQKDQETTSKEEI